MHTRDLKPSLRRHMETFRKWKAQLTPGLASSLHTRHLEFPESFLMASKPFWVVNF